MVKELMFIKYRGAPYEAYKAYLVGADVIKKLINWRISSRRDVTVDFNSAISAAFFSNVSLSASRCSSSKWRV